MRTPMATPSLLGGARGESAGPDGMYALPLSSESIRGGGTKCRGECTGRGRGLGDVDGASKPKPLSCAGLEDNGGRAPSLSTPVCTWEERGRI
mmetsp:Transcript_1033/g.2600  ORF Transcript_1033/g.2600 Transcript_1033/m.2600 type:complete len:93 (+) Transcript_1033:565-843(+)